MGHGFGAPWLAGRPICIDRDTTILHACRLMRNHQVETVVVTDQPKGTLVPIGIVSAQDIVTRVFATGLDPAVMTLGDIAWAETGIEDESRNITHPLQQLEILDHDDALPVFDREGAVKGAIAVIDLLRALDES
jgi:CBS domain-containing protein